jgi:NADH-quinone oxidoreductase subunit C
MLTTQKLTERFGAGILSTHQAHGDETIVVALEHLTAALSYLKDDLGYEMLMSLTITDFLTYPTPKPTRFEVVYHLMTIRTGDLGGAARRIRLKSPVNMGQKIPTASTLWATADWLEREAWEMYGLEFEGHPNLKRLLTHMDFVGYPLRKDYPTKKRQVLEESDTLMDEMEKRLVFKGLK